MHPPPCHGTCGPPHHAPRPSPPPALPTARGTKSGPRIPAAGPETHLSERLNSPSRVPSKQPRGSWFLIEMPASILEATPPPREHVGGGVNASCPRILAPMKPTAPDRRWMRDEAVEGLAPMRSSANIPALCIPLVFLFFLNIWSRLSLWSQPRCSTLHVCCAPTAPA